MATWDLTAATEYIRLNTLDSEDFLGATDDRKTALLSVSDSTLKRKFSGYTIPNEAVYTFANVLASAFNDTMVQAQRGVASFAVKGITFTFKDWMKTDIDDLIPDEAYALIGVPKRDIKYVTM